MSLTRPRLLVPGLIPFDPRRETHRASPGQTTTVSLELGDCLVGALSLLDAELDAAFQVADRS